MTDFERIEYQSHNHSWEGRLDDPELMGVTIDGDDLADELNKVGDNAHRVAARYHLMAVLVNQHGYIAIQAAYARLDAVNRAFQNVEAAHAYAAGKDRGEYGKKMLAIGIDRLDDRLAFAILQIERHDLTINQAFQFVTLDPELIPALEESAK